MVVIVLVEDEVDFLVIVMDYFFVVGYQLWCFVDGVEVFVQVCVVLLELIVFDLMLFGLDGLLVCCIVWNFFNVLIIMIIVKVEEIDWLFGLEVGVDDYLCKLYSLCELMVCIVVVLCCVQFILVLVCFVVDDVMCIVCVVGQVFVFIVIEFDLFVIMVCWFGVIFLCVQLLDVVVGENFDVSDCVIDSYIKNLCCKFVVCLFGVELIQLVYGLGYCFEF